MTELKRGLGRGLSALLGEPVKTETPTPANAPAWAAPQPEPKRAPIEPPRNVFELPTTNTQHQPPAPAPRPAAPAQTAASDGPRSLPIDLVQRNPDPSEHEIREWLEGNLCRCTGYHNIVKAVAAAAAQMRS